MGWYTVAAYPTAAHIALHEQVRLPRIDTCIICLTPDDCTSQFTNYSSTPLLLILQPSTVFVTGDSAAALPFKAYEPTIEIRDRKTRAVFIEAGYTVETGEAERIAVDWTARGGAGGTSCEYAAS